MRKINGWLGVDFDGTLVVHGKLLPIGPAIPEMVEKVKRVLAAGIEVRIMTARVSDPDRRENAKHVEAIEAFCEEQFGQKLKVTCQKDYSMLELWDDRAVQVEHNTGRLVGRSFLSELIE